VHPWNPRPMKTRPCADLMMLVPKCQVSDAEPGEDQVSY
jgi:hypothetical protein